MKTESALFDNIRKFIEDNRTLLDKGASVELAGLDKQVQNLCAGVMQLSDEEREKYADSLQLLLDELTKLGEDLTVQKEALAHEIRYLSSHKKASVAYQIADAKANPADIKDDDCS